MGWTSSRHWCRATSVHYGGSSAADPGTDSSAGRMPHAWGVGRRRGKRRQLREMHREIKIAKEKGAKERSQGKPLAGQSPPNHEDLSEMSNRNGYAPFRLFIPWQE